MRLLTSSARSVVEDVAAIEGIGLALVRSATAAAATASVVVG
jgi:hypothetical protein